MSLDNVLYMGNIDSKRDWGHAIDYVNAKQCFNKKIQKIL